MNERENIINNRNQILIEEKNRELAENEKLIQKFIKDCEKKKITISVHNIDYIPTIGIVATHPNLLNLLNKNIKVDKEDLVSFQILDREFTKKTIFPGYLIGKNYMAMAHPYFRRGHYENSAFSPSFIDLFWKYSSSANDKYVNLELDRVRIDLTNRMLMEYDTWYGANFNKNIVNIEDGITKLASPLDLTPYEVEFLFGDVHSLNIKWYTKETIENNIKTVIKVFQAEEFKKPNVKILKDGVAYFPAKYIHAEFDIEKGSFRHFDGAIHFYNENEYLQRRDTDFNHNQKNDLQIKTLSQKLFKVNGDVQIKDWVELTTHYLSGNPLIYEYFEGKWPEKVNEMLEVLRNQRE